MLQVQLNARTLKAVSLAASTEQTRYYLIGVKVECRAESVTYVATDGHRMLVVREDLAADTEWADGFGPLIGDYIIPLDAIKALKVSGRSGMGDQITLATESATNATAVLGDRRITFVDGTFPDWRRVIAGAPETPKNGAIAQFNFTYLADFAKFAKLMEWPTPEVIYTAPGDPHAITFGDSKGFGILMPLRARDDVWAGTPEWLAERPALQEAAE